MAEPTQSSAPLKTAEGAISVTEVELTPEQKRGLISSCKGPLPGVTAQTGPAAVAIGARWVTTVRSALQLVKARAFDLPDNDHKKAMWEEQERDLRDLLEELLSATPALPATEDSSAGDQVEARAKKLTATEPSDKELMEFAVEEEFILFCSEDEFIDIARAVLHRFGNKAGQAQAEVQAEPVSSDPVAWHSKQYGTCWMHKQPYHLDAGTQFFVRGNPNPVATVLSGAAIQWHTSTAAFEHGTFFYAAPQAQPADALDAATIKRAARYCYLRDNYVREWVSRLESSKGKKTLDIGFEADGHDLDAAIDAAMAAAQEGGNAAKEA
ncbi:hypothetical protein ABE501_18355 [Comamonas testosteroni]